ncbi:hypothetical protein [Azotobacter chroococcum]|uniref:Ankyrin repeat domain-containing protein n=1 Tax=Azotobacter chroococcum TaxID=353 RepID=A0AAP9YJI1_9GAMM|nr:hypothetical protein [Azotobacter chroococcum]QQE91102.1 hypothetical protein GKQ51_23155 [Azotobacter chroococcum]
MKIKEWMLWGVGIAACSILAVSVLKPMAEKYQAEETERVRLAKEAAEAAAKAERLNSIRNYSEKDIRRIVFRGNESEVKEILEAGVCTDCSEYIYDALSFKYMSPEIFGLLVDHSSILEGHKYKDGSVDSVFHKALSVKKFEVARMILDSQKERLNECEFEYLYVAGSKDLSDDETIEFIGKMRGHPGYTCEEPNMLDGAMRSKKIKTSLWLIHDGVKVKKDDFWGYVYGSNTSQELFDALLEGGADINYKNQEGLTPLEGALASSYYYPKDNNIEMWRKAGAKSNEEVIAKTRMGYIEGDRAQCKALNERWVRGLAKGLRGEDIPANEDVSIPEYCKRYLN